MESQIVPLHLAPSFPSNKVMLFGEIVKLDGKKEDLGFVSMYAEFPDQTAEIELSVDSLKVGKSYVPSDVTKLDELNYNFNVKTRAAAESRLVNRVIAENPDLNVLGIYGGPLYCLKTVEQGSELRQYPLLLQTIDFYSNFLRKNIKAMTKADNLAAKQVIVEIADKLKNESSDEKKFALEDRLNESFRLLLMAIMGERN